MSTAHSSSVDFLALAQSFILQPALATAAVVLFHVCFLHGKLRFLSLLQFSSLHESIQDFHVLFQRARAYDSFATPQLESLYFGSFPMSR